MPDKTLPLDGTGTPRSVFVLGDGQAACELAARFDDRHDVTYVTSEDPPPTAPTTVTADPTSRAELDAAGVGGADVAIVATSRDEANLLAARLALTLGADQVVAFVYDPEREDGFRDAEVETVNVTRTLEGPLAERVDG